METKVSKENEMKATTQFLNEADVKTVTRSMVTDVPAGLLSATRVGYSQEIHDFLAKPTLISAMTWSTQSAGDVLADVVIPETAFAASVYSEKLKGFLGFRGTAVLKLQVNGNKFQAGRLLMVFIPQGNVDKTYPDMRTRSLIAATQLPRVELDLSDDTEVTMEIPYISPTPFYDRVNNVGTMGRVRVLVYGPLKTGTGSLEVSASLWVHFENVELVAPTAQMDFTARPKRRAPPTELEQRAMGQKPISGGLRLLSKAASSFARVPLLSSIAAPASWALECISGAAAAFGYSKPTSEEPVTKVSTAFQFHMQNHNGADVMPVMGIDGSNKLSVLPGFAGTDVDEMSLSHLVQIPAYFDKFTWSILDAPGTLLMNKTVTPNAFRTSAVVNTWTTLDAPPVSYFSAFFQYWRGSFVLTLKVVKTNFHSGRLMLCYDPAGGATSLDDSAYVFREILDVRETSEFRFVIPYVAIEQYKEVKSFSTGEITSNIGTFTIRVLNDLVAPDTVASSIEVLCEIAGGPDFELAFPRPHGLAPILLSTWAAQMKDVAPSTIAAEEPSSRPDRNQEVVGVGSSRIVPPSMDPAVYCVGEKVNSILQLMKRFTYWLSAGTDNYQYFALDVRPFSIGFAYSSDVISTLVIPTADYYSLFGPCFAYGRGSVRLMLAPPPGTHSVKDAGYVVMYPDNTTTVIRDSTAAYLKAGIAVNLQPAFADIWPSGCQIPAYQRLHTRLLRPSSSAANEPVDVYASPVRVTIEATNDGASAKWNILRAAGDDLTFGYFLGTPLVTSSIAY